MQILKKEVDDYRSRNKRAPPHCELVAKWINRKEQMEPLVFLMNILGTTEMDKYFTINIDPGIHFILTL